jgi:hypothetical protein
MAWSLTAFSSASVCVTSGECPGPFGSALELFTLPRNLKRHNFMYALPLASYSQ